MPTQSTDIIIFSFNFQFPAVRKWSKFLTMAVFHRSCKAAKILCKAQKRKIQHHFHLLGRALMSTSCFLLLLSFVHCVQIYMPSALIIALVLYHNLLQVTQCISPIIAFFFSCHQDHHLDGRYASAVH